uniref:SPARC-like 1 n=1 Tax=Mastacembelus armatus TaxID=205130 RepID=A0A3Q3MR18_9TELE
SEACCYVIKPHGKHHGFHKTLHTAKEKDIITEEANLPQISPTLVTFEASSQEEEDEELSSEGNTNIDKKDGEFEVLERRDTSTAVLLSEAELVDLLKKDAEEEEEFEEHELEKEEGEVDKSKEESGEAVERNGDKEGDAEEMKMEHNLKMEEESKDLTDEENVNEESVEDKVEMEVEKMSREDKTEESASKTVDKEKKVASLEETDGSTESEIPLDLDYVADNGVLPPLQTLSTTVKSYTENSQPLSKIDVPEVKEKETNEEELSTIAADSKEVVDEEKIQEDKNDKERVSKVTSKEMNQDVDPQEPTSSTELESGSRVAGKEEEKSKKESGTNTKGKTRKQKKNQRTKNHPPQTEEPQDGQNQTQHDLQGSVSSSTDNTVHKAKRRRAGKWGPLVGVNPVQIRATVDLYPRSRSFLGGGIHRPESPADPCDNFHCKRGKMCKLDADNKPGCVCKEPSECPPSVNEFEHVCGTDNKTYDTSCELFATKCNLEGTKRGHKLHLDYTGPCKLIPPCVENELVQFPLRMRDWLKNVLLQLYEHDSMSPGFLTPKQRFRVKKIFENERRLHAGDHSVELLAMDFEKNYNMYIYPVHWQFAQLDQHPSDRFLSHSELAPLRVPLVPMEHCTSLFFQECDADKDKQVSFKEWTSCFGIRNEDMDINLLF